MSNFSNFKARVKSMSLKRMNMYIAQIQKNYGANRLFTAADMCVCAAKRGIGYLDYTVFGFAKVVFIESMNLRVCSTPYYHIPRKIQEQPQRYILLWLLTVK